jgi:hypothetical protein
MVGLRVDKPHPPCFQTEELPHESQRPIERLLHTAGAVQRLGDRAEDLEVGFGGVAGCHVPKLTGVLMN